MSVNLLLEPRAMPNGTILVFHIRYENQAERNPEATRGRTDPLVYSYTMSKAGNLWYTSGAGRVPQAAGWGAVEKWLERDGRQVVKVEIVTDRAQIWPIIATVGELVPYDEDDRTPGSHGSEND